LVLETLSREFPPFQIEMHYLKTLGQDRLVLKANNQLGLAKRHYEEISKNGKVIFARPGYLSLREFLPTLAPYQEQTTSVIQSGEIQLARALSTILEFVSGDEYDGVAMNVARELQDATTIKDIGPDTLKVAVTTTASQSDSAIGAGHGVLSDYEPLELRISYGDMLHLDNDGTFFTGTQGLFSAEDTLVETRGQFEGDLIELSDTANLDATPTSGLLDIAIDDALEKHPVMALSILEPRGGETREVLAATDDGATLQKRARLGEIDQCVVSQGDGRCNPHTGLLVDLVDSILQPIGEGQRSRNVQLSQASVLSGNPNKDLASEPMREPPRLGFFDRFEQKFDKVHLKISRDEAENRKSRILKGSINNSSYWADCTADDTTWVTAETGNYSKKKVKPSYPAMPKLPLVGDAVNPHSKAKQYIERCLVGIESAVPVLVEQATKMVSRAPFMNGKIGIEILVGRITCNWPDQYVNSQLHDLARAVAHCPRRILYELNSGDLKAYQPQFHRILTTNVAEAEKIPNMQWDDQTDWRLVSHISTYEFVCRDIRDPTNPFVVSVDPQSLRCGMRLQNSVRHGINIHCTSYLWDLKFVLTDAGELKLWRKYGDFVSALRDSIIIE
jgi:hypothetical protein